jgi:hypothetical protein
MSIYIYTYDIIYVHIYIYTIIQCTAGLGVSLLFASLHPGGEILLIPPEASSEDPHPGWPPPTIRGSHQRMD